jgi:alpha-D-ribose 1-methylphosphonate 5-triphosphate synthase subunit PhnI
MIAERSARNGVEGASDLDTSMTFWKWEVKRYARLGVESIMQRAELDQAISKPRVDHTALLLRADNCEWLFVVRLHDLPQFIRDLDAQRMRDP